MTITSRALHAQEVEAFQRDVKRRIANYRIDAEQYRDDAKTMEDAARIIEERGEDPVVVRGGLLFVAKQYRLQAREISGIVTGLREAMRIIEATLLAPPESTSKE